MKKIRSYQKLVQEIINMQFSFKKKIAGYVEYGQDIYPFFEFSICSQTAKKTIIITSGQHGNEPFAITTLMKWIQQFNSIDYPDFNFYIYPLINAFGYETGSRENGARQDTNEDKNFYKNSKVQELAILYDAFPVNVNLILDIHGDSGKQGKKQVYMYEHKSDNLISIAEKALLENDNLMPYLKQKTLDKNPIIKGVVVPPECDIGIEGAMEKLGVEYTMTLELPGRFNGQQRTAGGIAIINSILKYYKETLITKENK